jgi:hypothetical protein
VPLGDGDPHVPTFALGWNRWRSPSKATEGAKRRPPV